MSRRRYPDAAIAPDYRLEARYRRLSIGITLPVFTLVCVLAGVEYVLLRDHTLQTLSDSNAAVFHAVDDLAKQADDHVLQMKAWSENPKPIADEAGRLGMYARARFNGGAPDGFALDDLPEALKREVGQVLWLERDSVPLAGGVAQNVLHDFFALNRLTHSVTQSFRCSYLLPAGGDYIGLYPWRASAELVEGRGRTSLHQVLFSFFEDALYVSGAPARNPNGVSYWITRGDGSGLVVSHGAPLYRTDRFAGVVAADFEISRLQALMKLWPSNVGRLLLLDDSSHVLADSHGLPADRLVRLEDLELPALSRLGIDRLLAQGGWSATGEGMATARPIAHAPWKLVMLVGAGELWSVMWPQLLPYGLILAALGGTLALSLYVLRREFITPALRMVDYLQQVCRDSRTPEPHLPKLWQPWVDVISRSFSAHREALHQLRAGEAFKSAIVENSMLAVISMDQQGHIKEFNRAAEQVFGFSADQALGTDLAELIIPERYRAAHRTGLERHLRTGVSKVVGAHLALSAIHADGHEFPIELTIFVTPVGEDNFYTAFVADHTQRKQAEEEVARQREALRQSEKLSAMGALLAGVAHELNNPLAILMGRAALLEDKAGDEGIKEDAARIRIAADRCGRIVKTFLSMARQKPVERKPAYLNEVATGAVELLGYGLRSAGIELQLALDQDLEAVEMDADQVGQVLVNLIVNAQQALSSVPAPRVLRLETRQDGGSQYLRISDNGPGVPESLRDRIFDPFFTTKADGIGTGIGLSVSRAILREHGGELYLETPGTGASFLLRLPAVECDARARPGRSIMADSRSAHEGVVMIVDDEPEVAAVLGDILGSAGYEVHVAGSGGEALRWLDDHPCDLLFSDVRMPDMDGITLWRNLRTRHPELASHMALVTGDTLSAGIAPLIAETGLPCLEKPFLPDEVLLLAARIEA